MEKREFADMAQPLRFALIGCGGMGARTHAPNFNEIPGCSTVAYCDLDLEKAEAALERFGGEYATTDADRVFADDRIDGVLIQTGERAHPKLVKAAVAANKHVFCEKPLAVDLEQGVDVTRAVLEAEKRGIKFQFGTCNRYAHTVRLARKLLPNPAYSYCQCTDTVSGQFCHNIDLAIHAFHTAPIATIYAHGGQFYGLDPHLPVDSFTCIVTFDDGSSHTSIQHGKARNLSLKKYHFQLFGTDSCVYLAERFKRCEYFVGEEHKGTWRFDGPDFLRGDLEYMGHKAELEDLVRCIREGGRPELTIEGALRILAVEKAVFESIEQRAIIDFKEFWRERVGLEFGPEAAA